MSKPKQKALRHRELEFKYRADHLSLTDFKEWAAFVGGDKVFTVIGRDVYWKKGKTVVRHRQDRKGELTIKQRTSQDSLVDRIEVDLALDPQTTPKDVSAFMEVAGYESTVSIMKTSHIFEVDVGECSLIMALYSVKDDLKRASPAQFLEIEVSKESDITVSRAKSVLNKWQKMLEKRFTLKGPLNSSLYELYR